MAEPPDITPDTVVFFDANALVPFYPRGLFIGLHEAGLLTARWSKDVVEEVLNWLRDPKKHPGKVYSAAQVARAEQKLSEDHEILVTDYQDQISKMTCEPEDRHVLAAAVVAKAQLLVTDNVRHFPPHSVDLLHSVDGRDIRVVKIDDFLVAHFARMTEAVFDVLRRQAAGYRSQDAGNGDRAMTVPELLRAFERANLPNFFEVTSDYLRLNHPELLDD